MMMDERMVKPTGRRGTCPVCRADVAEVGPATRPGINKHHRDGLTNMPGMICEGSYLPSERLEGVYTIPGAQL